MKVRMVLEGGALRGLFTAGVLDVLMENKINIDEIIGTSAGALFGVNYFSEQIGRAFRYNRKYLADKRYMSLRSLILTGNYINKKFAFYKVTKELDPFDNEMFIKSKKRFYAVATNIETGKAEYFKINSPVDDLEKLRASSAIPLISKIINIDGKKYLDGGISDSIPFYYRKEKFDKNIVILTQPLNYKKIPLNKIKSTLIKLRYMRYPKLINAMINRHNQYNNMVEKLKKLENKKEIFVIRPNKSIEIKLSENNQDKYQEIYNLGVDTGKKVLKDLKDYLKG